MMNAKNASTPELPEPVEIIDVPGVSMAMVELATAQALAQAAHNATVTSAMGQMVMVATTARGVATILGNDKDAERLFELIEKKLAG